MKQTNFFNISVPELGDRPDITQVSNAISNLEDALAGTMEYMNASVNNKVLTLTSATRKTKRTGYHTGLTCVFTSGVKIDIGGITSVVVDNLPAKPAELKFIIDADDSAIVVFDGTKFAFKHAPMPRSNAIDSSSEHFIATSRAVKTLNDNKAEKTVQVIAGNGLTGGGDLTSNKTINVVSADAGIVVNADNIKLNVVNAINSTDAIRPATANAVKTAYDKGVEGLNKANEAISLANSNNTAMDNKKVNRSGDTMTGNLTLPFLKLTANDPKALLIERGEYQAMYGASNTAGDCVLGIRKKTAVDYEDYIRIGNNKLQYQTNGVVQNIYHTGNKPSKADVGLSSVPNYPATSSVSDTSNEKFATAGAVKQAYDRASSGINEANTKVSKAGDTMTGTLIIPALEFRNSATPHIDFTRGSENIDFHHRIISMGSGRLEFRGISGNQSYWFEGSSQFTGTATATKFLGPLQGNADTATKLATPRQINGTNFDGTGNITTANWGASRNLTVGATTKSVNGGSNVGFSLDEIGTWELRQKRLEDIKIYDLNELKTPGFYVCHNDRANVTNFPPSLNNLDGTSFAINVYSTHTTGSTAYVYQEFISLHGHTYSRMHSNGWGEWRQAYHQGFKPSKADVGLGDVNNWTATSAVNDSSNSKYATAGAVKTAYDKGVEALNKPYSKSESDGRYKPKNRGLFMNVDVPESFWTSAPAMSGKTGVGGINVNTGSTPGYIALSSSTSTLDLFIDGDMYVNEGRNKVYSDGNKPSPGTIGAVNKAGDTMTGDLFLKKGSPIIRLNDSRSATANTGYLGFGSAVDTLQIVNGAKNAVLNISDTFSFSKGLSVGGGATFSASIEAVSIELRRGATPYIDFSNGGATDVDYHHRIISMGTSLEFSGASGYNNFKFNGAITATGNITAYSDIKLKEDLEVIPDALNKIGKLNGYTYTRKDSGERHSGVVAQEVQAVLPEVITSNKDEKGEETLSVAYGNMVGLLIEGIKELKKENNELRALLREKGVI